jgi:transcriptional regulator with XRE-family HTH domain
MLSTPTHVDTAISIAGREDQMSHAKTATPQLIEYVTREMKRRKWTAVKLAEEAKKNGRSVSHPTIYGLINGTVEPQPRTLDAIATGFGIDPDVLRGLQYPPDSGLAADDKDILELKAIVSSVPKPKRSLFMQLLRGMADQMRQDG